MKIRKSSGGAMFGMGNRMAGTKEKRDQEKRRDEALARALSMPPKPHKPKDNARNQFRRVGKNGNK